MPGLVAIGEILLHMDTCLQRLQRLVLGALPAGLAFIAAVVVAARPALHVAAAERLLGTKQFAEPPCYCRCMLAATMAPASTTGTPFTTCAFCCPPATAGAVGILAWGGE